MKKTTLKTLNVRIPPLQLTEISAKITETEIKVKQTNLKWKWAKNVRLKANLKYQ